MCKKPEYHVVSFSGGKDSTALLLRMLELGMKVDEVLNCDTYMEFVYQGLRDGVFPWGYAVKMGKNWSYYISPIAFSKHTGLAIN